MKTKPKITSNSFSKILQKHIGSHSELKACVWLQQQGYEVFKNISCHGEIDLIIWNPETNETFKVDVTTAHYYSLVNGTSKLGYAKYKKKGMYLKRNETTHSLSRYY